MKRSIKFEDYIKIVPEKHRKNISILGDFCGDKTKISFIFSCGCKIEQNLKSFLLRNNFERCSYCKKNNKEENKSNIYNCSYCLKKLLKKKNCDSCHEKCQKKYNNLVLGKDYIICQICGYHGRSLKYHILNTHGLNKEDYISKYGSLMCTDSYNKYSESGSIVGNWYNRAKERGEDLSDFKRKVSEGVRKSIMSNLKERKRRSDLMIELNKKQQSDPDFQRKVSETAKKTSARKDIQEKRAQQLKKWRDNNPEDFYEKCIKKATTSFQSKPELKLYEFLSSLQGFSFKRNQFVHSVLITNKSSKKQLDIGDKEKRIYIEFDGVFHFEPIFSEERLQSIQQKDREIEEHISNHNWTLIRVSHDQFCYSTKIIDKVKIDSSYFKQECLDKILEILNSNIPGIYKIGSAYCTQPSVEL